MLMRLNSEDKRWRDVILKDKKSWNSKKRSKGELLRKNESQRKHRSLKPS